ncbi:MAG: hypothetical protein JWO38_62 [Gemmataceae bacterium]|nr:hypothetical protein [Gemmataceae bacterium]
MTGHCTVYEAIDQVPPGVWEAACGATPSCFTDRDFLRAVEGGLPADARVYHAIVADDAGRPAAGASLCLLPIDVLLLAGPLARRAAGWCRRVFPRFGRLRLMCCGLPVSAGQSQVGFAAGADRGRAVGRLDALLRALARRERAGAIVFKEFDAADVAVMDVLRARGYIRADSPPMYDLTRPFPDFEAYCAALRSHYRSEVRRSQRKFEQAGCRVAHLRDPAEIVRAYTPAVHRLYEAVVAKSDVKFELLPATFFHQLAGRLSGRVSLTTVSRGGRIVAFTWGLACGPEYHILFCGIDYDENPAADLYFNVMYHQLDLAFRSGARAVRFGQTADAFKTRVGCTGSRRYFYARGAGPLLGWVIRRAAGVLGPPRFPLKERDVFKDPAADGKARRRSGRETD